MTLSAPQSPAAARPLALVTGAAVRIGRAISLALASAGYDLIVHTRHPGPAASSIGGEIEARGARAHLVHAELSDAAAVAALLPACARFGVVRLLVNNASEFHPDAAGSLSPELWNRHFAVNLRAPVFLAEAFAAQLPAGETGAVVNLIDQRVLKPTPHYLSYSLTKQGLWAATRLLAQSLAPRVRVNAVSPGPTFANSRQSLEDFARQSASVPLGRGPQPEEVAAAVLFLARAESVTGQMLTVDGGQHMAWQTPDTEVPD
ncbi:SDR family oxidoreductase [Ancylobacter oerskovii]|uniref:SDR family oxidoreductase n=1 Tax=Ancylobacter oerskovii TaxID=459519 RepID=A0ABW4Z3Y5_9HYPH|nr:SDR family oxidoreductase [Ancylobacter oerskovii]MBS7545805.1 SDR family oxidoreductase [Ancylobacter oerskovii]